MRAHELRAALLSVPVPDELEAHRRTWSVVGSAYAEREPIARRGRRLRLFVAVAVLAAVIAAAVSPPGRSVGGWLRDRVAGAEPTQPALVRLPGAGRLLVVSERGPWIVRADGAKRLLGRYEDASFSPNGLFVVATRGRRVVALEPDGDPRWSVTRPNAVEDARWAPSPGFRVAYREGDTLRVVGGNGTGDRLLVERVTAVAPAWLPLDDRTVLAYADAEGRIHVTEVDGEELWSADPGAAVEELVWSPDGRRLLVVTTGARHPIYRMDGSRVRRALEVPAGNDLLAATFAPVTGELTYATYDAMAGRSTIVVGAEQIQEVEGRLEELIFSPDGRWLLSGWPEADQLLFLRLPGVSRIEAVSDARSEFDPGRIGATTFPRVVAWCC